MSFKFITHISTSLAYLPAELQVNPEVPDGGNGDRDRVRHIEDQEIEHQIQYEHIQNQPREANDIVIADKIE